ncbi:exopolysaccharide biosynthesis polyprenyl glycosylphosphotransferase [Phenylobacterium sp.]|jgi:Undecaprenyl-phosphate glucose phosphotransferase|uniref:exopolysaccharide biosynthesis polyprenyl glycosylphosphotransferase n=1 Tax=Phenylobacterium sp. TaxID=1871053 RepID=UPI002E304B19|nr:exopolysaccharide biosynthesis polyprenyl glycosylphosphotransferase [Phenylobacterium sp.]HEX2559717.1 exopolysaccharide biosynthesis polyprenyl glycosylphosphotransferase [Phenylobacterium sp.]
MSLIAASPSEAVPALSESGVGERRGSSRPARLAPTRIRLQGRAVAAVFQAMDAMAVALVTLGVALRWDVLAFAVAALIGVAGLGLFKAYHFGWREGLVLHLSRAAVGLLLAGGTSFLALAPFLPAPDVGRAMLSWTGWTALTLIALHALWWASIRRWRRNGRLTPNIVVVGATEAADRLVAAVLKNREANILGVFDDRLDRAPDHVRGVRVLGDTHAMLGHRIMPYVDRIVITVPGQARERVRQLMERLRVLPNEIALLVEGGDAVGEAADFARIADVPLATISGVPRDAWRAFNKRAQDLVVGTIALILAAPVMLLIALVIRLDSPGPVLFRQRRHGFNNEEIVVWKFRSMRHDRADPKAAQQVMPGDERVTRIGRFIRSTSLDELPQLFNVLAGEMSLVGPRPHAVGMKTGDVESARLVAEYAHRHRMKPGMTGWAAIHGSRGPVDTPEAVRRRVALDVAYIERQSFWLDLYIMAMTIPCLLGDRAAVR